MGLQPQRASRAGRIDTGSFQPRGFIATAMDPRWRPRHSGTVNSSLTFRL